MDTAWIYNCQTTVYCDKDKGTFCKYSDEGGVTVRARPRGVWAPPRVPWEFMEFSYVIAVAMTCQALGWLADVLGWVGFDLGRWNGWLTCWVGWLAARGSGGTASPTRAV